MAWPVALPTFTDGMVVDEGDLDPLVDAVADVRDAGRWLRGKWIIKSGFFISAVTASSEVNIPELLLDGVSVVSGQYYLFCYNIYLNCNNTPSTTSFLFRVRDGGTSGAVAVDSMFLAAANITADDTHTIILPWKATSSGTKNFYFSTHRQGGSSTISIRGDGRTAGMVMRAGDDATTIWTTVT
jgi:hypothetical protein